MTGMPRVSDTKIGMPRRRVPFRPKAGEEMPEKAEAGQKPTLQMPALPQANGAGQKSVLEVDVWGLKELLEKGRCVDREGFSLERFIRLITLAKPEREGTRGAFYLSIRTEDGQKYRLYPQLDNLASMEKLEKCDYVALVQVEKEFLSLYRQRD